MIDQKCTPEKHVFLEDNKDGDCQCGLVNDCRIPLHPRKNGLLTIQKDNRTSSAHS